MSHHAVFSMKRNSSKISPERENERLAKENIAKLAGLQRQLTAKDQQIAEVGQRFNGNLEAILSGLQ